MYKLSKLKYYRDLKNSLYTAKEEEREERETKIVLKAIKKGYSIEDVIELTV